jgi:Zinc-binding dehydrogenase
LCAGITTYSPLRHWSVAPGKKVAIAGLGGLGHVAVQFAAKMGADVTVVTTSPDKEEGSRRFGANDVLINKDGADWSKYKRAFDFFLDTIPYQHGLDRFFALLKRDATLCRIGVGKLTTRNEYGQMTTVLSRTGLAGSNTGGIRETHEMLNLCAIQNIKPRITKIPMGGINDAWSKVVAKQSQWGDTGWQMRSLLLFLGLFLPPRIFGMPQMRAVFLLLWRDLGGCLTGWHGIASHRILEPGRREDESQTHRSGANVSRAYPRIRRDEHKSTRMDIALLIAEPNVSDSAVDQQDFILGRVPMLR